MRPISLAVDITQLRDARDSASPIHGYDADKAARAASRIRRATRRASSSTTLDGTSVPLSAEDLRRHRRLRTRSASAASWAARPPRCPRPPPGRPRRGRALGPGLDGPHRQAPQAAERGRQVATSAASTRRCPFVAARRVADLMVELAGGTLDTEVGGALHDRRADRDRAAEGVRAGAHRSRLRRGRDHRRARDDRLHGGCRGRRLVGHPAVVAPDLDGRADARRGGRPHPRVRPHPLRAPRPALRAVASPRHSARGAGRRTRSRRRGVSSRLRRSRSRPRSRTTCTAPSRASTCRA